MLIKSKKIEALAKKIYVATDVESLLRLSSGEKWDKTEILDHVRKFCLLVLSEPYAIADSRIQASLNVLSNMKITSIDREEFSIIKEQLIEKIVSHNNVRSLQELVGWKVKKILASSIPESEKKQILLARKDFLEWKKREIQKNLYDISKEDDGEDRQFKSHSQIQVTRQIESYSTILSEIQRELLIIEKLLQ